MVLKDPNEDQDDVLRANRSREKQYIFDCAFGPNSSQVSHIMTYLFFSGISGQIVFGLFCEWVNPHAHYKIISLLISINYILFGKKVRVLDMLNSSIVMISPLQKFQREKVFTILLIF